MAKCDSSWDDPKVKWKQALIRESLRAELNNPDEAMSMECLLSDAAEGRENQKFPVVSAEFTECLAAFADSSSVISVEYEETGLICEGDAEQVVTTFITCASNLLVPPAHVLKFFGVRVTDEADLRVARRHIWTELLLTQGGQRLVVEAALDIGMDVAETAAIDTLLTEALRKTDIEQVFRQAVGHMVDPEWVQPTQIDMVINSFKSYYHMLPVPNQLLSFLATFFSFRILSVAFP